LVVRRDADLGLLKLIDVRRRRGPRSARSIALLVNLLSWPAATESVPCALMIDARYMEWVTAGARFDLQVAIWLLSPIVDLDGLGLLTSVCVAGWP
jgi:hypothetical protein